MTSWHDSATAREARTLRATRGSSPGAEGGGLVAARAARARAAFKMDDDAATEQLLRREMQQRSGSEVRYLGGCVSLCGATASRHLGPHGRALTTWRVVPAVASTTTGAAHHERGGLGQRGYAQCSALWFKVVGQKNA